MPSLSDIMAAAQQAGQPQPQPRPAQQTKPAKPNSVMALLRPQTNPVTIPNGSQAGQTNEPQTTGPTPPPHIICGATPCPACRSTWIIESYGPSGRTQCYGCKAERSQLGLFDYDVPALTAAAATMTNASALTITQFIDAVITAGYPQLAEMARKYQPTATQPTRDKTDEPKSKSI